MGVTKIRNMDNSICILDIETTGFEPGEAEIIELFILKIINAVSNFIFIEEDVEDDEEDEIEINNEKSSQHIEDNKKNIHKSKKSKQVKSSANAKKKNTINTINTAIPCQTVLQE